MNKHPPEFYIKKFDREQRRICKELGIPPLPPTFKTGYFTSYSNNTIKNQNQDEH